MAADVRPRAGFNERIMYMNYILSPSILAADCTILGEEIRAAAEAGAQYIHIDVMDGWFVPSMSFGNPMVKSLRKATDAVFDVHLMVQEPERYINEFAECGADIITVHAEACTHLDRVLDEIHAAGCRTGVALNPATPLCMLDHILTKTDMVLIMTVNPGFGGAKYIDEMTEKIATLRERINRKGYQIDIEVDGGIYMGTLRTVLDAGANVIVAGSAIYGKGGIRENVKQFLDVMQEYEK